jgi:hypothetical protein
MKRITLLILLFALGFGNTAQSQDTLKMFGHHKEKRNDRQRNFDNSRADNGIQTLTGPGHNLGFYFGFNAHYSQIDGYDAFSAGAGIAMIANHGLAIGFAGKGFFTEPFNISGGSNTRYGFGGGYGGLLIEPIVMPRFPVHVSFPILFGAGGIARSRVTNFDYPYDYTDVFVEDAEAFLVAEPGVEIEFNVARWMRLGIGGTYRFTTSLEPSGFSSNPLNGFTGGLSLKFGKF